MEIIKLSQFKTFLAWRYFTARDGSGIDVKTDFGWQVWETVDVVSWVETLQDANVTEKPHNHREWRDVLDESQEN